MFPALKFATFFPTSLICFFLLAQFKQQIMIFFISIFVCSHSIFLVVSLGHTFSHFIITFTASNKANKMNFTEASDAVLQTHLNHKLNIKKNNNPNTEAVAAILRESVENFIDNNVRADMNKCNGRSSSHSRNFSAAHFTMSSSSRDMRR
jgi:hypothetical protein